MTTEQRFREALERITRMAYPVADGSEAERISAVAQAALDDAAPTGNADPPEPDCALCGHDDDDHGPGGACPELPDPTIQASFDASDDAATFTDHDPADQGPTHDDHGDDR